MTQDPTTQHPHDLDALLATARSDDPRERQGAALVLGTLDTTPRIAELVDVMVHELDDFVRETLIWAIVSQGAAAVPSLVAMLYEPGTERERVLHTLSKIGDPSTVQAIAPDAANPDRIVASKAWWALGRIGTPEALPPLLAHLGEGDSERRDGLTWALLQYGPRAVPALVAHLGEGPTPAREHAADVLVRLADPLQYSLQHRRDGAGDEAAQAVLASEEPVVDVVLTALAHDEEHPDLAAHARSLLEKRTS